MWAAITTPLQLNDAWIEMSQTINAGLGRISAANVIDAVTASARNLVDGITETEAFQTALSVGRETIGTASTSYLGAGAQEISNLAGTTIDQVGRGVSRAQNLVADAAMSYVEAFEEAPALDIEGITAATNMWQQSRGFELLSEEELAHFGTDMIDPVSAPEPHRVLVDRMLDECEQEADLAWRNSQWGGGEELFARYAREAAETVRNEDIARAAARTAAGRTRTATAVQEAVFQQPDVSAPLTHLVRRVNAVYSQAFEATRERDPLLADIAPEPTVYADLHETSEITHDVLEMGRQADPIMRPVNLRVVSGDQGGAIWEAETVYRQARVPSWQLDVHVAAPVEEPVAAEFEPLLEPAELEIPLAALEPAEEGAVLAPEVGVADMELEAEVVGAGVGGLGVVVGLAVAAAGIAGMTMISTIDAPARVHARGLALQRRMAREQATENTYRDAWHLAYTSWHHYKGVILHRRSMADADRRFSAINPRTGLWQICRVLSYEMRATKWSESNEEMWRQMGYACCDRAHLDIGLYGPVLPTGQSDWGPVRWPPENERLVVAYLGAHANHVTMEGVHLLHPAPLTPSQLAFNRSTLARQRAILLQNLMWEAIRVANRALVGAMLRHANDQPRMGDDEGVLRIRFILAAHHGTMGPDLPPALEPVAGATIDRWIRLATHLTHLGAEAGPTGGWTRGDVCTYFGQGPGVLTSVGERIVMRQVRVQPDFQERGVIDIQVTTESHLVLVNRNPFSEHVGWDGLAVAQDAATAAGVDLAQVHQSGAAPPPPPPSAPWVPPGDYRWRRLQNETRRSWVEIPQSELDILVWTFLVVNNMTMTQVLAFVDGLGPFSPNQVILAFQAARERRARDHLQQLPPHNAPFPTLAQARIHGAPYPTLAQAGISSTTLIRAIPTGALAPFPTPAQAIPRRRLVAHGLTSRQFPMRQWVQLRIPRDFSEATVPEDPESDAKTPEILAPLYSNETLARIRTETRAKTPVQAAQDSFKYLEDIIRDSPNVTPDGPDRAFSYEWRGIWSNWLAGFDKTVHALTQFAKIYTEAAEEDMGQIDSYMAARIREKTRQPGGEVFADWVRDKVDWYNWRGAPDNRWGGEREWRLDAFKWVQANSGIEYDVTSYWNLEPGTESVDARPGGLLWEFLEVVVEALNAHGYRTETDAVLRREKERVEIGQEEQERIEWEKRNVPAKPSKPGVTFILVAVLAVLAFLLMSR